jgi:hypothetical protein
MYEVSCGIAKERKNKRTSSMGDIITTIRETATPKIIFGNLGGQNEVV